MLNILRRMFNPAPPQEPVGPSAAMHLQERIVQQIASELPPTWDRYKIHYENFVWQDESFEKYISTCHVAGGGKADYSLSLEALDLLIELQKVPVNASGEKWTHLTCEFDSSGKYKFDFLYGVPPLTAKAIEYAQTHPE